MADHDVRLPPFTVQPTFSPLAESIDWGLSMNGVPELWVDSEGEDITVAVLDNGVDVNHSDLAGAIAETRDFSGFGFSAGDHGTPVCGVIGARKNERGIVGVAPKCRIIVGKVLHGISGDFKWTAHGIRWAVDSGADIINLSLGGPYPDHDVLMAIEYAVLKGCWIICAAGNDGSDDSVNYPAKFSGTVAVGAVNRNRTLARFSSRGPEIDCCGPGEGVTSTSPGGGHSIYNGTSFAAPFVTGVVALMKGKHKRYGGETPVHTYQQLIEHIAMACEDAGPGGKDQQYGHGIISPKKMLLMPQPPVPEVPPVEWLSTLWGGSTYDYGIARRKRVA